jgi:Core-2/I-Branching enzyme
MHISSFDLCSCLNNASFFTDLDIDLPVSSGPFRLSPETSAQFVEYIESSVQRFLDQPEAVATYQRTHYVTPDYMMDTTLRGACLTMALGNQPAVEWGSNYVRPLNPPRAHTQRILRTIDSNVALPFLNYEVPPTPRIKQHYQIAYVLMVHENFENVKALIDALSDPQAFIYVHVDYLSADSFKEAMSRLASERRDFQLMPTQFYVSWAHVSLLWIEVRAFFDLLDMIDFDYVVNLSGADYPLHSTGTVHAALERVPTSNWLWWSDESIQIPFRSERMFYCQDVGSSICRFHYETMARESRGWESIEDLFPKRYKGSQWMILHRTAVEDLRTSESGKILMWWAENMLCPDEIVLTTYFAASPVVAHTYRDPKRLMLWRHGWHPQQWTIQMRTVIETWQEHFFWLRKVDVIEQAELRRVLDRIRQVDQVSKVVVVDFTDGIIPVQG